METTEIYHNMLNDGGALIKVFSNGSIELYEVPLYGGEPQFIQDCETLDEAMKIADTWT